LSTIAEILEFIKESSKAKPEWEERGKRDFELWKTWKDSGEHPDHFRPLLHQFRGILNQGIRRWENQIDIPPAVIHAEFNKQFLNAARQYDPKKNASFGAYIKQFCLKKVGRYFTTYQNPARIVETRSGHQRGLYNNAVSVLSDQFGREPTTDELSEHLGWSPAEIGRARAEGRRMLTSGSTAEGATMQAKDESLNTPSRELEVLKLVKPMLTPEETKVYEYLVGDAGRPKLKPGEIADREGWNPSKVTRYKNAIAAKIEQYL
jgi:DNA-directed RNA polymerase specialized sigma subunit